MSQVELSDVNWMTDNQINGLVLMYKNKIAIDSIRRDAYIQKRDLSIPEMERISELEYRVNLFMYNIMIEKIRHLQGRKTKSFYQKIM